MSQVSSDFLNQAKDLDSRIAHMVNTGEALDPNEALRMCLVKEKEKQGAVGSEPIQKAVAVLEHLPGIWPAIPENLQTSFAVYGRITSQSFGRSGMGNIGVMCIFFKDSNVMDREFIISQSPTDSEIVLMIPSAGSGGGPSGVVKDFKLNEEGMRELTDQRWLKEDELSDVMEKIRNINNTGNFSEGGLDYH